VSASPQTEFGFGPGPAPQLEIFGLLVHLQTFGVVVGIIVLPFALGYLARANRWLSAIAFIAFLLTVAAQQSLMLHVGGLAPSTIPFPWEDIGGWALFSIPAAFAGYFAAIFVARRQAQTND
tara:strand:+ start:193 stop:558 length:366 start_codon:yes stop_codon:yes gene_type:complete